MNQDMDRRDAAQAKRTWELTPRWVDTITASWVAINSRRRTGGDWSPYTVYVLHIPEEGLFKIGVSRTGSRRLKELLRSGRVLVDTLEAPNGYVARLLEATVLLQVAGERRSSTTLGRLHGKTECWRDTRTAPDLALLHAALTPKRPRAGWTYSLPATPGGDSPPDQGSSTEIR